jgi:hypothetical protein
MSKLIRYSLALLLIFIAVCAIVIIADDASARTCTWDGGGANALASTKENWDTDVAPIAGDNILINTGSKAMTWDVSLSLGTFTIASGYSGTITQSSDMYITGFTMGAGTFTGVVSKIVYCSGNFAVTAGTVTTNVLCISMTGSGTSLIHQTANVFFKVIISSDVTVYRSTTGVMSVSCIQINNGGNMIIPTTRTVTLLAYSTWSYLNQGQISGAGTIEFRTYSTSISLSPGTIGCSAILFGRLSGATLGSPVVTLTSPMALTGTLTISSSDAEDSVTVDANGMDVSASSITIGTRGGLHCGSGTITANILDSSVGYFNPDSSNFIFTGVGTLKLSSIQSLYRATFQGTTTLLSNAAVSGFLTISNSGTVTQGVYYLNITSILKQSADLYGSWGSIYLTGAASSNDVFATLPMKGTVYFNEPTSIDNILFTPTGWANATLLTWGSSNPNAYGTFYLKGVSIVNMTAADGRYALWNGLISLGDRTTSQLTLQFSVNAVSGLLLTLNPCPVFTTQPNESVIIFDTYKSPFATNEDGGVVYTVVTNQTYLYADYTGQKVIGVIEHDGNISVSLMANDGYGGLAYQNYTVVVITDYVLEEIGQTDQLIMLLVVGIIIAMLLVLSFKDERLKAIAGMTIIAAGLFVFYDYGLWALFASVAVGLYLLLTGVMELYD